MASGCRRGNSTPSFFALRSYKQQHATPYVAFTPDTCSPDTSCIHLYVMEVHHPVLYTCFAVYIVSCIGDKIDVTATSTCIRIQVVRPGYLHPATCIWCKRGFSDGWGHGPITRRCFPREDAQGYVSVRRSGTLQHWRPRPNDQYDWRDTLRIYTSISVSIKP